MATAIDHSDSGDAHPDPHRRVQDTRRRVLEMQDLMKHPEGVPARDTGSHGRVPASQAVDLFLALLQDRLPGWLRVLDDLMHQVGKGSVTDNLLPITRAAIDYYAEVQVAALPAFSSPAVTVRFRHAMRTQELGPGGEVTPLARYLAAEQRLGRIAPDADPEAAARLLLAGSFGHAFYEMFLGPDALPSRDQSAEEIVRELRLEPH